VDNQDGRTFLEKIVQANFELPAIPVSMVHQLFNEELEALAGRYATQENSFSPTQWGNTSMAASYPSCRTCVTLPA
jgi:hypothetical protein